jgi:hypothetical protein
MEEQEMKQAECCGQQHEHGPECRHGPEDKLMMMMHMAKGAKMELLKEKVKKKLEAAEGKKLDKIADALVDLLVEKHKAKSAMMRKRMETKKRLEEIMMEE